MQELLLLSWHIMQFAFGSNVGQQNPLFQFMDQRGDAAMDKVFIDDLNLRHDPRIGVYADTITGGIYAGAGWDYNGEEVSAPGPAFAAPDAPVLFITYAECLFIKAECDFKTSVAEATVQQDLIDAVSASMNKWGVYSPLYMHVYDSVAHAMTGNALFREIMAQKNIALIYQAEAFNDWRRTENVIGLTPNPKGTLTSIPRRFPYSTDEKSYNPNVPQPYPTISDRVWWDVAPGRR